ncbi:MAG TPA: hypothetical protein VER76_20955, partial [Pyrinomonadaceae bacterium]|nr:hypothetical protein [Pyrinomonadaceae bacterium]
MNDEGGTMNDRQNFFRSSFIVPRPSFRSLRPLRVLCVSVVRPLRDAYLSLVCVVVFLLTFVPLVSLSTAAQNSSSSTAQ